MVLFLFVSENVCACLYVGGGVKGSCMCGCLGLVVCICVCVCVEKGRWREVGVWFVFVCMCVEGGGGGGCACEFEGVQEFVFILRGDPGGRFWLVLFLFV